MRPLNTALQVLTGTIENQNGWDELFLAVSKKGKKQK